MNEYYQDASYFSLRCVGILGDKMSKDASYDSVLYFAFCIERLFKGILWDIDPRMVLENSKEDNCFAVLHREHLLPSAAKAFDKPNHNTITFKEAMLKAKHFSQVTHDHIGMLTELSDYRGIIAHRLLSHINGKDAGKFVLRYFHPIIGKFVDEHNLLRVLFFGNHESNLAAHAKAIEDDERLAARMEALLEKHRLVWVSNKDNETFLLEANRLTDAALRDEKRSDYWHHDMSCPACSNRAVVRVETDWDVEGSSGEGWMTGVYAANLNCKFCQLVLDEYDQIDFFKLNDFLEEE